MSPPCRTSSRDGGFSLIEILVAVSLLGLAIVGTLPAMWSSVKTSDLQESLAGARQWIVSAGDYAVSPALLRMNCSTATAASISGSYVAAIRTASSENRPSAWQDSQLTVTSVRFWDGVAFPPSGCSESTGQPSLQQISLQVTAPDGDVLETLEVVKGDQ